MAFRNRLLESSCAFSAEITADYTDNLVAFTLDCTADNRGNLVFTVTAPMEIAGIGGTIKTGKGSLVYQDTILSVPLLAQGELSPVSAPWILLCALRGGYIASAGTEGELLRVTVNDSFADNTLQVDIWFDSLNLPQRSEIFWQGRRVLSIQIKDFQFV